MEETIRKLEKNIIEKQTDIVKCERAIKRIEYKKRKFEAIISKDELIIAKYKALEHMKSIRKDDKLWTQYLTSYYEFDTEHMTADELAKIIDIGIAHGAYFDKEYHMELLYTCEKTFDKVLKEFPPKLNIRLFSSGTHMGMSVYFFKCSTPYCAQ